MIEFDDILEFDDELYKKNINDHTFPEPDKLDGMGGDDK